MSNYPPQIPQPGEFHQPLPQPANFSPLNFLHVQRSVQAGLRPKSRNYETPSTLIYLAVLLAKRSDREKRKSWNYSALACATFQIGTMFRRILRSLVQRILSRKIFVSGIHKVLRSWHFDGVYSRSYFQRARETRGEDTWNCVRRREKG